MGASSALEKLRQYTSGKELSDLIATSVQPKDVADRVLALAARLADEAAQGAAPANCAAGAQVGAKAAAAAAVAANAAATEASNAFAAAATVLEGVTMTSPWGKHDIAFGSDQLLLRKNQQIIAVPYSAIQHVAILESIPKEAKDKNCVVMALRRDSDIKAGKTRLDVLVAQTKASPEVTVPVPPGCEHLSEGPTLTGPAAVVLCQLLGAHLPDIQDDTFTSSDPAVFRAGTGDLAISANVRTASGWLFPLPGALLFLGKPAHFIRHSEVTGFDFQRTGAASSTFDAAVALAGGGRVEFGQMDQGELARLQAYVAERHLPVGPSDPNAAPRPAGAKRPAPGAAAGAAVAGGGADAGGSDDDDSDEEDSDFDPDAAEASERGPPAKRLRTTDAADDGEDLGSDDSGDEGEEGSDEDEDEDEDSSDVSLVNSDEMSGDEGGGASGDEEEEEEEEDE